VVAEVGLEGITTADRERAASNTVVPTIYGTSFCGVIIFSVNFVFVFEAASASDTHVDNHINIIYWILF
jgi:hypothetical protein